MKAIIGAFFAALCCIGTAFAQSTPPPGLTPDLVEASILRDNNGDGVVTLAAFGDSITFGTGDAGDDSRPSGYPLRIERLLGLGVRNWGDPGERLTQGGVERFFRNISNSRPDIVIISEGSNDTRIPAKPGEIYRAFQKMINVARAVGVQPVITTIIPKCCDHATFQRFVQTYNPEIYELAAVNGIPLADPDRAFDNTCVLATCFLLNSDGLHPNNAGYDVMAESIIATILNINLFAPDGPLLLSQALGVPVESIRTLPDPVAPSPPV